VTLQVKDGGGPRARHLIAIGRDGCAQLVTSWNTPRHDARANTMRGGAALHPDQIDHYEVRTTGGEHLDTLKSR
jgi:hypothetical protein